MRTASVAVSDDLVVTTVFPRQGRYALDQRNLDSYPGSQMNIERIGDLLQYDRDAFLGNGRS
jgi:hypothetical protein